ISIGGINFRFIDTAGIRETKDVVESIGIKRTFEKIEQAQVIIYLFDAETSVTNLGIALKEIEKIKNKYPQKSLLVIANKIDKLDDMQLAELNTNIPEVILLSAKTGFGISELTDTLLGLINTGALRNNDTIVTNSRHYDALLKALEEIKKVQHGLDSGLSGDLLAIDIRQALYHFGEITGEITSDDLLGNIFANFCIGK
ncbi:MAG: tRNA uridine-5-carboxymethylaminomethyl(34) synthesis GTPase MnmE, partial [Flavobacteriaceae bacterium]